jgi:hypothetical protein
MSTNVYVLKLEHGKYYVGKTTDSESRIRQHFAGYGSAWTKLHPPTDVLEIHNGVSGSLENSITRRYLDAYGWENVRGGSYCTVDLQEEDLDDKHKEVLGQLDRCLSCGREGHWAADCYANSQVLVCHRCGREGHTAPKCYARSGVWGRGEIKKRPREISCYRCGREGHIAPQCYTKTKVSKRK